MTESKKKGGNMAAGVAGIVVGAAATLAATKVLSNKDNQEKIKKALSDAKESVKENLKDASKRGEEIRKEAEKAIEEGRKDAEKHIKE